MNEFPTETATSIGIFVMIAGGCCVAAMIALLMGWLWTQALIIWARNFNSTVAKTQAWIEFCNYRKHRKYH
jgi:hypothetical protein